MTIFNLSGRIHISPSLFLPPNIDDDQAQWPNMRKFHVLFNMASPDGQWYFEHNTQAPTNDEEDDGDEGRWGNGNGDDNNISSNELRTYPNTERIMPLLKAMALAATKMPDLQDIGIKANIPTGGQSLRPCLKLSMLRLEIQTLLTDSRAGALAMMRVLGVVGD